MLQLTSIANAKFKFKEQEFVSYSSDIYTVNNTINSSFSGGLGMGNYVKMINSNTVPIQTVESRQNVLFTTDKIKSSIVGCKGCSRRIIEHDNGSGLFTITQGGIYRIMFSSNFTTTEIGNVVVDIEVNGEPILEGEIKDTVATANTYVHRMTYVDIVVPCGTSKTVSIGNNSETPVLFQNANIEIKKQY